MKTYIFLLALGFGLVFSARVHSQAPAAPKSVLQQVQLLKAQNASMLDRQAATLLRLGEIEKESAQLKFLSKRS